MKAFIFIRIVIAIVSGVMFYEVGRIAYDQGFEDGMKEGLDEVNEILREFIEEVKSCDD